MTVNKINITKSIGALNLNNSTICIHSSLKSFGYVEGGAQTVVDAFLDSGCTILVPTFTYDYIVPPGPEDKPQRNAWEYGKFYGDISGCDRIFTTTCNDISKENMGAIPSRILQMPQRKRGYNPISSFAAIGPKADELVAGQSAADVYAPFKKLYDMNGYIILMGVGLTRMTAIHYAEQKAGRTLFIRWANGLDGKPVRVSSGGCSEGFENFAPVLERIEKRINVGQSLWRVLPMKEAVDLCTGAISENPIITSCGSPDCKRCRDAVQGGPIL